MEGEPKYTRVNKSSTEIELDITVTRKLFDETYKVELAKISQNVRIQGFRPGKAPVKMVEASHGKKAIEEVLNKIMPGLTVQAMTKEKIQPVIPVTYEIVSMDKSSDVVFKAIIHVMPEIKIPSLKKIKVEKEAVKVEAKELEGVIKKLWQDHKGDAKNMDDAWVKKISPKLGFKSSTIKELEPEIKNAVLLQKKRIIEERYSSDILKKAIELTKVEIPEAVVLYEMKERELSFNEQLEKMKVSVDQFCQIRGVTIDQLRDQWKKDSHEALKNDAFLAAYSRERKITISDDEIEGEIKLIKSRSKDKGSEDSNSEIFANPQWKGYIKRVLLKRKSFAAFLSEVGGTDSPAEPKKSETKTTEK